MQAWVEIDKSAIFENCQIVKDYIGSNVDIIGVIKADAYGHGINEIVPIFEKSGISMVAVISLEEAIQVRKVSKIPVLILGFLELGQIAEAIAQGFHMSIYDPGLLSAFNRISEREGKSALLHAMLETGLNREGIKSEDLTEIITSAYRFPHIRIVALFSHLSSPSNKASNSEQLKVFQDFLVTIDQYAAQLPIHFVSSYALSNLREGYFDAVRVGLALFGSDDVIPNLKPAFSCKSRVMQIKTIPANQGISYDGFYTTTKATKIAVVSIGYANGLTQKLENNMTVLIKGVKVPVIGKICMNMLVADISGVDAKQGDEVVIIGRQNNFGKEENELSVKDLAQRTGLRHHEIIVRLGNSLERIYK